MNRLKMILMAIVVTLVAALAAIVGIIYKAAPFAFIGDGMRETLLSAISVGLGAHNYHSLRGLAWHLFAGTCNPIP